MEQTKVSSFVESLMNVLIGYFVALGSQLIIFPAVGIHIAFTTNLWIGLWFTLISLVRSYVIRRWFNKRIHRAAEKVVDTWTNEKDIDDIRRVVR